MNKFKILLSVFLLSFLVGCGPKTVIDTPTIKAEQLPNGCLVTAEVFQAHLIMNEATLWNRILVVYYTDGGKNFSHAYCLFEPKPGGHIYAYDATGSTPLNGNDNITAVEACKQLVAFPTAPAQFVDDIQY